MVNDLSGKMTGYLSGFAALLTVALSLAACGSSTPSTTAGLGANGADLTQALDCRPAAALDLADAAAAAPLRHVPAKSLHVLSGGQDKSLCDLLQASGKQLALIQFVGIHCYGCAKWVDSVSSDVKAGYAKDVQVIAVVVDPEEVLSDVDLGSMKAQVAPDATWVRDVNHTVWDFFSLDAAPGVAVTPLTVVMDWAARGFYSTDKTKSAADLVALADTQMQLGIAKH